MAVNWNLLLQQAGQMPQRRQLTLGDLFKPQVAPDLPQMPEMATQLDDDQRREYRRQMILQLGQAIGAGSSSGRYGEAFAEGAANLSGLKGRLLEEENQRRMGEYALQRQRSQEALALRQVDAENAQQEQSARGRLGIYERILAAEPGMADRAEQLARAGDDKGLLGLLGELPARQAIRSRGGNPDDPFADEEIEARIKGDADLSSEKLLREQGLGRYFQEPKPSLDEEVRRAGAIAEAQASAYARHRAPARDEVLDPRWAESGDMWGVLGLSPDGKPMYTPAEGMTPRPRYELIKDDNPYDGKDTGGWANPYDPGAPLIPVNRKMAPQPRQAPPPIEKPAKAPTQGSAGTPADQKLAETKKRLPDLDRAEEVAVKAFLKQGGSVTEAVRRVQAQRQKRGKGNINP